MSHSYKSRTGTQCPWLAVSTSHSALPWWPGTCEAKGCEAADICGNGTGWMDAGDLVKGEVITPGS